MTTRIIISLPKELLELLDVYCKEKKYNRSECIRHAIRIIVEPKRKEATNEAV